MNKPKDALGILIKIADCVRTVSSSVRDLRSARTGRRPRQPERYSSPFLDPSTASMRARIFHTSHSPGSAATNVSTKKFAQPMASTRPPVTGPNRMRPPLWYGLLPGMSYTWRVRTTTVSGTPAEGDWTAWSARAFRTPVVTSESISLISPIQESTVGTLVPTLRWSNSNAAIFYYEVQVSEGPAFNTDPATAIAMVYWELRHGGITNPTNSYTIPQSFPLKAGTTYYWRVRPRVQGDGVSVEWSPIWIFRTQ